MSANPFRPKRSLGQNFLTDPNIQRKIIEACGIQPEEYVLEVGPGTGALTDDLSAQAKGVIAVETDRQLVETLSTQFAETNVTIIHADFLKYPLSKLPSPLKLVGNLPYYISSPIIEKLLKNKTKFLSIFIMLQWELGKRLIAKPGTKDYSSLSCFVQYHTEPKILFKIKNTCFRPAPKVDSCFLELKIPAKPRYNVKDEERLFNIIRLSFQQRRKTIGNSLARYVEKPKIQEVLGRLKISDKARAENLSLEDFVNLANEVSFFSPNRKTSA